MNAISTEGLINIMHAHTAKYWRVYDSSGKSLINQCLENITISESIDNLKSTLDEMIGDYALVRCYQNLPDKVTTGTKLGSTFENRVRLKGNNATMIDQPQRNNNQIMFYDLQQQIMQLQIEKATRDIEEKYNKMYLAGVETETDGIDKITKLLEHPLINGVVGQILSRFNLNTAQSAINGIDEVAEDKNTKVSTYIRKHRKVVDSAIETMLQVDKDAINTLVLMANYIVKNPTKLAMIKGMLQ